MAYKINPLTGKMDLVSSSEDIAASMTVSGELFESLNNLKAPKTIDNQPVNEVMEEILFRPYAPAVAADFSNQNAYNGEVVAIKPQWIVTKKSNALAALKIVGMGNLNDVDLTQNGTTNISRDAGVVVNATVSDTQNGTLPAKRVVLSKTDGANLEFTANTTIKATATDEQGLVSDAAINTINFHYPTIIGSINSLTVKGATMKKDGLNYPIDNVVIVDGGDIETPLHTFSAFGRNGAKTFTHTVVPFRTGIPYYIAVLVQHSSAITSFVQIAGSNRISITPQKIENAVVVSFKNGQQTLWTQNYDKYLITDPNTADSVVLEIKIS